MAEQNHILRLIPYVPPNDDAPQPSSPGADEGDEPTSATTDSSSSFHSDILSPSPEGDANFVFPLQNKRYPRPSGVATIPGEEEAGSGLPAITASQETKVHSPPTALTKLEAAIRTSREAEMLHAYDVGVCAALQSMEEHWTQLTASRHVSNSEKRIFRREAERLRQLLVDAEREMLASAERLARKEEDEQRWWREIQEVLKEGDPPTVQMRKDVSTGHGDGDGSSGISWEENEDEYSVMEAGENWSSSGYDMEPYK